MKPGWILSLCLFAPVALAQSNPADEWGGVPASPNAQTPPPATPPPVFSPEATPPPPAPPPGYVPPPSAPIAPAVRPQLETRPPEEPNNTSMYGAPALGLLKRGQSLYLGFPLIGARLAMGLHDRVDFGIGFLSFWGLMNGPEAFLKVNVFQGTRWSAAVSAEGSYMFFNTRAPREVRGPRWISGLRNGNASLGGVLSYKGDHPRAARLFLDLRYLMSFDTEPFARDPLSGVPANLQLGHNVLVRMGAEMPLGAKTSFVFKLGVDVHGRYEDAPVMPNCAIGIVTGL